MGPRFIGAKGGKPKGGKGERGSRNIFRNELLSCGSQLPKDEITN